MSYMDTLNETKQKTSEWKEAFCAAFPLTFKGTQVLKSPYPIPESFSVGIVVILHLYKKNALIIIFGGTTMYIVFTQFIFV
jgi:branched-subunit amino acid transport protein AzlD